MGNSCIYERTKDKHRHTRPTHTHICRHARPAGGCQIAQRSDQVFGIHTNKGEWDQLKCNERHQKGRIVKETSFFHTYFLIQSARTPCSTNILVVLQAFHPREHGRGVRRITGGRQGIRPQHREEGVGVVCSFPSILAKLIYLSTHTHTHKHTQTHTNTHCLCHMHNTPC